MNTSDAQRLLTMFEVAHWLQVSDQTVRRWIRENGFPAYQPLRDFRFLRPDVEAWIQQQSNVSRQRDLGCLLTIPQVMEQCGISRATLYRRLRARRVPIYRLGPRFVRIAEEDVTWLA